MRKAFILLLAAAAILLAGYAGYRGYRTWNDNHLISLARGFLAKADTTNALLCVQQVLRSDPQNLKATRVMADLTESARSPSALLWRSRVVKLNPHSLDDRLALAQTALLLRDLSVASNALAGVDAADQKTAAYQNVAGAVATAANQPALAEKYFLESARLEPNNPVPELNLAILRLHGTNEEAKAEARLTLQRISNNPTNSAIRSQALRELVVDALLRKQYDTSLRLSQQLLQQTNAVFSDKLLQLNVLRQMGSPRFKTELAGYQREAAKSPGTIYDLATWQMAQTSPQDALDWLRSLPPNVQTNQPVELLAAECYNRLQDWHGLQKWLDAQNWGQLEFLRLAFETRALRGQKLGDSARIEWQQALKAASGQRERLHMLLGLTAEWQWRSESEELLWNIFNQFPNDREATQALIQTLFNGGRTKSLMQVFRQQFNQSPANLEAKNNLAMTALLVNAQELDPNQLAQEVYRASPTNSAYASTYAFSLYLQGKQSEALKVIGSLKPQQLENPAIAGYYGVILEANGDSGRARAYLERALNVKVLPEEEKLFKNALAKTKQ